MQPQPPPVREGLYFVDLGGYKRQAFAEQHRNMFVVATSPADIKAQAPRAISGWNDPHREHFYEAGHVFALDAAIGGRLDIPPRAGCDHTPAALYVSLHTTQQES